MKRFSLMSALAGAAMLAGGMSSGFGDHGGGSIHLPVGVIDTAEDRRLRNEAAGGRKKRIKKQKARGSLRRRVPYQSGAYVKPLAAGRIFLKDKRHAAFLESMKTLESIIPDHDARRKQAMKNARRVAA